mmetsp:Transcript_61197/g.101822  ORF Transcript_61197/g.101822 Transcript_61197/m.101822 type:complete len:207 (+) Transcript_61197:133-753(+)
MCMMPDMAQAVAQSTMRTDPPSVKQALPIAPHGVKTRGAMLTECSATRMLRNRRTFQSCSIRTPLAARPTPFRIGLKAQEQLCTLCQSWWASQEITSNQLLLTLRQEKRRCEVEPHRAPMIRRASVVDVRRIPFGRSRVRRRASLLSIRRRWLFPIHMTTLRWSINALLVPSALRLFALRLRRRTAVASATSTTAHNSEATRNGQG